MDIGCYQTILKLDIWDKVLNLHHRAMFMARKEICNIVHLNFIEIDLQDNELMAHVGRCT